jgi:hypothetical protein
VFVISTALCREITHQGIRNSGISWEGIAVGRVEYVSHRASNVNPTLREGDQTYLA